MVKKYLLYFLMVFLIGITIQIIGVFVISDLGISQYKSVEIEKKEKIVNLYVENEFDNINILNRAHAYWGDALLNVQNENDEWIQENLSNYLIAGEYNIDFVYISNESGTYERGTGISIENVVNTNAYSIALNNNLETNSIIEANGENYIVSAYPLATDSQEDKQGVLIIGRLIDEEIYNQLMTFIGQDLHQDHLIITTSQDTFESTEHEHEFELFNVESSDETLYIYTHLQYQYVNFLETDIQNYLITISVIVILCIVLTILISLKQFNKQLNSALHQLNKIDLSKKSFNPLVHTESIEFNQIIDVINNLGENVEMNINKLISKNLEIVELLSTATEINDPYTSEHSKNVAKIAVKIAKKMNLPNLEDIELCAKLHDVGKVFIQHTILNKKGTFSKEEYAIIRQHPILGAELLEHISQFESIRLGVIHHHEKYDGSGYPNGLKGEEIPLIARIITIADVYDAITSDRPYRKAFETEAALQIMIQGTGKIFDPEILKIFFTII